MGKDKMVRTQKKTKNQNEGCCNKDVEAITKPIYSSLYNVFDEVKGIERLSLEFKD